MEKHGRFLQGMLCGVCVTALGLAGVEIFDYAEVTKAQSASELNLDLKSNSRKIKKIEDIINEYFYEDVDSEQVEDYIYKGMIAGLDDKYAAYYTQEELARMQESTNGEYDGIGVTITQDADTGYAVIAGCYKGTPAAEAGLQAEDVIKKVNGQDISGIDLTSIVSLIKTAEGDQVILTISRKGETEDLEIPVERRRVEVPTVEYEMLDGNIGYIKIAEFDAVTTEQFREAKAALEEDGMEKLIVDLRSNLGGVLDTVCDILREILPEGLIVYTEDKNGEREEYTCDGTKELQIPLAVLINGYSASASEIFAGAVKDYGIGTLVGTTTYGKGIVQQTIGLSDGSAVKLTIAKYFTPLGHDIHGKGVEPDVEVELDEKLAGQTEIAKEEDNQLQKAIEILQQTEQEGAADAG